MFEGIDETVIQSANNAIKEINEKFKDSSITSLLSKEEILERDFDNMFIFEDFFSDYLAENRHIDDFKKELIENLVDLISINDGNITIEELYEIITSGEVDEVLEDDNDLVQGLDVTDLQLDSDYEILYGKNHRIDLDEFEDSDELAKHIKRDIKRDSLQLTFVESKSKKSKIQNPIRVDLIETKQIGADDKKWNLFKKKH